MLVKSDVSGIGDTDEVKALSAEVDIMNNLTFSLKENINKMFQQLNEESIATQMIKVLQKKSTEQAVIILLN